MKFDPSHDILVVGAGPAGLAAAHALARLGLKVAAIGLSPARRDTRTAALFAGSVTLLENLGLADTLQAVGEPIYGIRIIDDMGSLWRAPEVTFSAQEVGLERLGFNIANADLTDALRGRAASVPELELIDAAVTRVEPGEDAVEVELADGRTLSARLAVGADGRQSMCRAAAGIEAKSWRYEQSAVTCTFAHRRPHNGISTEFHRPHGPCTVVPSPGSNSSLVWVEAPEEAARLVALDDAAFRTMLEQRLQGLLGAIGEIGPRGTFPLTGLSASPAGRKRIALAGEAVHVVPPIGAQGLNLGLRDAASIADCVADALAIGGDIGAPSVLAAFDRMRGPDIASRVWSIDLLNRTLLSRTAPVQLLRGLGMHALKSVGPLRRLAMREGLTPSFVTPRLMQPPTVHTPAA
jgi:2-octaprenyl-6-methoxyphenol hydroxylase